MKFRKTAVALAVAGVCAAPMVAQADTTLSGVLEMQYSGTDLDDDPDTDEEEDTPAVTAGDVRVQIHADQELNADGLTGYGNVRFNIDDLSNGTPFETEDGDAINQGTIEADEVYTGIMGDFGDVRIGEIPLGVEFGQLANDIYDIGAEVPGGLSYTGAFGPVELGLNYSPVNNSDMVGAGAAFNLAGFSIGLGFEDRADTTIGSVGAGYTIAGVSLAAHYWAVDSDGTDLITTDDDDPTVGDDEIVLTTPDAEATGLAVQGSYGIGDVTLALTYATYTLDDGDDSQQQALRLDAGYALGGGLTLSTRLTQYDSDDGFLIESDDDDVIVAPAAVGANDTAVGGEDLLEWRIQLAKVF